MTANTCRPARALWLVLLWPAAGASAQTTEPGPFHELAGAYRGTVKRTQMALWVAPMAASGRGDAVALLLFPESQRQDLVARLQVLAGEQEALYRRACESARVTEYGYDYNAAFSEIWNSGAALVLIHSGPTRTGSLASGWRTATARSGMVVNEEYASLRGREYMVSRVTRDPRTGRLTEVRLTQTGFIQNFFANPALSLVPAETPAGVLGLVDGYVTAKYTAMESLGIGRARLPTNPPAVCR